MRMRRRRETRVARDATATAMWPEQPRGRDGHATAIRCDGDAAARHQCQLGLDL